MGSSCNWQNLSWALKEELGQRQEESVLQENTNNKGTTMDVGIKTAMAQIPGIPFTLCFCEWCSLGCASVGSKDMSYLGSNWKIAVVGEGNLCTGFV